MYPAVLNPEVYINLPSLVLYDGTAVEFVIVAYPKSQSSSLSILAFTSTAYSPENSVKSIFTYEFAVVLFSHLLLEIYCPEEFFSK